MTNLNFLILFLERFHPVSDALRQRLEQIIKTTFYKKGQMILKIGRRVDRIFFLKEGLVRWTKNEGDRIVVSWFSLNGTVMYMPQAFRLLKLSTQALEAREDSVVQYVEWENIRQLYIDFPETEIMERMISHELHELGNEHAIKLKHPDKVLRVKYLMEKFPGLIYRTDRGSMASFLGMGPTRFREIKNALISEGGKSENRSR